MTMKNPIAVKTIAKDLVCGMDVETASAAQHSEHKGQAYHFCGSKCKAKFDHNPELYLSKAGAPAKAGGCCG